MMPIPIVALDVGTFDDALRIVDALGDTCDFYKVGSALFTSMGPSAVTRLRDRGKRVFLDLKFHDIPNTVRAAATVASQLGASLITVHASGGEEMLRAAVAGAGEECGVLAVTALTSMDGRDLAAVWGREAVDLSDEVVRLARLASTAGAHGVVCAGAEIAPVRRALGDRVAVLVPGIRFDDGSRHDQRRVVTPGEAARLGATYLVVGRAATESADPRAAMRRVHDEISALASDRG